MMNVLKSFFQRSLPKNLQPADLQDGKQSHVGLINLIVFATCLISGSVMYFYDMNSYLSLFLLAFVCLVGWLLYRAGQPKISAVILITALLVAIQFNILAGFGIHDVAIIAWPAFIFFTGLLFGWRAIPYFTALIILLAVVTKLVQNAPFVANYSDTGDLIVMLLILVTSSLVTGLILRSSERSILRLRSSEERFQAIYNSIHDAIMILDSRNGSIVDANAKMLDMFGYTHREAILLDIEAVSSGIPPYTSEKALEWIQKTSSQGDQHFEWQAKDKSGRLFWVDMNMNLAAIGSQPQILVSLRDISANKQSQEAQSIAEANYHAIFENATVGIFQSTPEGRFRNVNPAMARIYGYASPDEMLASISHISSQIYVNPANRDEFQHLLAEHGEVNEYFGENYRKDGSIIWTVTSARVVKDKAGQISYYEGFITDITERMQAEAALRESEARYRFIAENTADVIWVLNVATWKFTYVSPSVEKLRGYSPEEVYSQSITDALTPESVTEMMLLLQQRLAPFETGGESIRVMTNRVGQTRKDGTVVSTEVVTNLVVNAQGQLVEIVGVSRDITERELSENMLRESEEKYRHLVEGSPYAILVYKDNQINFANAAAVRLLRAGSVAELLGRAPLELVHADYRQDIIQRMNAAREMGHPLVLNQEKWHRFDGSLVDVEVKAIPITFDQNGTTQLMVQDITERMQAEQAIRESEERFRAVVQTANDAIITMDMQGTIVSWNTAAETIFNYSTAEALGMPVTRIVPAQISSRRYPSVDHKPANNERQLPGQTIEVVGVTKEGREFPIEMSLTEWMTEGGSFFTVIIRDITERKQRENELQAIASLSAALRTAPSRADLLSVIVKQLSTLLHYDSIAAEIIDPTTNESIVEVATGDWSSLIGVRQLPGTGPNAILREMRFPIHNNKINGDPKLGFSGVPSAGILEGIGIPLIAQDQIIGMLWVGRATEINESEVRLLASVADIAANALYRATLHERTEKDAADLSLAYDTTLEGWAHALELRDQDTVDHSRKVVQMTVDLARAMGIREDDIEDVRRGALLHDIGKMGIPDSVLLKPGTLNDREWEIMRRHPEYAFKLLEPIEYLHSAADIPYCHHEKWDGSGYPRGLKKEEIPLVARIFAIVDVWEALRTDRPYRKAWDIEQSYRYIQEQAGKHFDPSVVAAFLSTIRSQVDS